MRGDRLAVIGRGSSDGVGANSHGHVFDPTGNVLARIGRFGNYERSIKMAHSIAVAKGSVYVGDITGASDTSFMHVVSRRVRTPCI
jgi:hypothetical protein